MYQDTFCFIWLRNSFTVFRDVGSHVPLGNQRRMMGGGCGEEGVVSNILAQGRPAFLVAGRPQQSLG